MNECPKCQPDEPCQHMFSMTLRNGDRVCRRCDLVKRVKPEGDKK